MDADEKYMRLALAFAKKGKTEPNPKVGCVIVRQGEIIGKGYHRKAGLPHAEIEAIKDSRRKTQDLSGATMYITLEPCSCQWEGKRTPPCTEAVLRSGVSRLVVAMEDPHPKVSGSGIGFLKKKGIKVEVGMLEKEARELNLAYANQVAKNALCSD